MNLTSAVGYFATICSIVSFAPQAWKIIKSRDTRAISAVMYTVTVVGFAAWFVFGVLKGEWPLILTNGICFLLAGFILLMKLMPRASTKAVADALDPEGLLAPPNADLMTGSTHRKNIVPKAVIFDVDGTLIDTVPLHAKAWAETFRHFGYEIAASDIEGQIGKGGDQLIKVFLPQSIVEVSGEEMEAHRADLFKDKYYPLARGFPGVRALFERIHLQGSAIGIASSCKSEELKDYLKLAGVPDLVDAETTSDDAEKSKPFPDIFEAVLKRLEGVEADNAVVVGDSPYDAQAAVKAGIKTVGLLCGGFAETDLRAAGCIAIYANPEDLLQQFDDSPLANR